MEYLLALITALTISMVLTPLMVRFAPLLGLIDSPDPRKIHSAPIPRVGGVGIVVGALVPILLLVPLKKMVLAYVCGSIVLMAFGIWDDKKEIGHYTKFIGQFIAVAVLVYYGGLSINYFPYVEPGAIPVGTAQAFTVFAIMGVVNAINHSDGLDGLAGGESLVSLGAMAILAYLAGGGTAATIALAVIGGLLGFLRYNTHPATVFMGDSGSQFLGYTLGFLVVVLTQRVDPDLSPAVVLLLLGLPIVDILIVLARRISGGMNWFRASRNHVHHRLLDLGFIHQESVVIIYSVQILSVMCGVLMRRESDWAITLVYALIIGSLFGFITIVEHTGWRRRRHGDDDYLTRLVTRSRLHHAFVVAPRRFLAVGIPAYFIGSCLWIANVPRDFASMSALLFVLMVLEVLFGNGPRSIMHRALVYVVAAFVVYLGIQYPPNWWAWADTLNNIFYALAAVAFATAVKFSPKRRKVEFDTTAMDYLLVFILLAALLSTRGQLLGTHTIAFIVQIIILFYGCELIITEKRERWSGLTVASLASVLVFAARGLLIA